ncbi:MAG: 30S ribosomal protein S4 [Desulfobacterales bacterium]|nr:30S ribosomal protein S4 [Desulfobacterales bacterium]
MQALPAREGLKLFLKGDRCYTEKCAFERRGYPPGEHGQRADASSPTTASSCARSRSSSGCTACSRSSSSGYFERADRMKGITGTNLLVLLERRLDNVVFRLGFANSRDEARQLVRHSHFLVNGKKVNIPSYLVKVGRRRSRSGKAAGRCSRIHDALETVARRGVPQWLELDKDNFKGVVKTLPDPRRHHDAGAGAAGRRTVLEVSSRRNRFPGGSERWQPAIK